MKRLEIYHLAAIAIATLASLKLICVASAQQEESTSLSMPKFALDKITNFTSANGNTVWLLVPSGVNLTERLEESEFNLFKLNSDTLWSNTDEQYSAEIALTTGVPTTELRAEERTKRDVLSAGGRESRKINFLRNVLSKPKVSPLYLVNGTVCRFVNSQPICTTLSTTGLFRNGQNSSSFGGQFQQGNNFQTTNQQGFTNPQQGQRQLNPPNQQQQFQNQQFQNQQFQNQQFQNQPFRPSAIIDDDSQELNVGLSSAFAASNSTDSRLATTTKPQSDRPTSQANRPVSYVVSRRPLNLFSFGRPFRQYQAVTRRSNDATINPVKG